MSDLTRENLLDAAELLFADHGYDAVSLRQVTRAADANVAAIHYHFGGKEQLLEQVLLRRMAAIAQQRAQLMAQAPAGDAPEAQVRRWVQVLIAPLVALIERNGVQGRAYLRLMGQCHAARPDWVRELGQRHFGPVMGQFSHQLSDALPALDTRTVRLRGELATHLVFSTLAANFDNRQPRKVLRELEHFVCAGLVGLHANSLGDN